MTSKVMRKLSLLFFYGCKIDTFQITFCNIFFQSCAQNTDCKYRIIFQILAKTQTMATGMNNETKGFWQTVQTQTLSVFALFAVLSVSLSGLTLLRSNDNLQ